MISTVTHPGDHSRQNEDWVGTTDHLAVVLDGLSAPEGVGGCEHGTPWYVNELGHELLVQAADPTTPLRDALRESITQTALKHTSTCDLTHGGTPSATVAIARIGHTTLDALVLADSPVVVDTETSGIDVLVDHRVDELFQSEREDVLAAQPGPEKVARLATLVRAQRKIRNTPEGYWIAGSNPAAADHALEKSWPVKDVVRFAAMSDGVSCLTELYEDTSWAGLLDLADQGVEAVLARVRQVEASDPEGVRWPRYKPGDDAALAYGRLG
ncbi:protein phosphatase 2C domain-containing protein [Streptomyces sp. NPDC000931]|uniref:protein phosphatase 2C domain-containing protein n=1 Tax=Streptomyces sp. NPDC000931 TaxID=3154372 RepID=UPI0033249E38